MFKFGENLFVEGRSWIDDAGYINVWYDGRAQFVHRLVMEEYLGRKLTDMEIVHHIDEDKQNNEWWNLQLTNLADHTRHHALGFHGPVDPLRLQNLQNDRTEEF